MSLEGPSPSPGRETQDARVRRAWRMAAGVAVALIVFVALAFVIAHHVNLSSADKVALYRPSGSEMSVRLPPRPTAKTLATPEGVTDMASSAGTDSSGTVVSEPRVMPGTESGMPNPEASRMIDTAAFVASPTAYYGAQVDIRGKIARILGPRLYTLVPHVEVAGRPPQEFLVLLPGLERTVAANNPTIGVGSEVSERAAILPYDPMVARKAAGKVDEAALNRYQGSVMLVSFSAPRLESKSAH